MYSLTLVNQADHFSTELNCLVCAGTCIASSKALLAFKEIIEIVVWFTMKLVLVQAHSDPSSNSDFYQMFHTFLFLLVNSYLELKWMLNSCMLLWLFLKIYQYNFSFQLQLDTIIPFNYQAERDFPKFHVLWWGPLMPCVTVACPEYMKKFQRERGTGQYILCVNIHG